MPNEAPSVEEEALRARVDELAEAADRVADFADYWVTREEFERLLRQLFIAGGGVAAGILLFAVAVNLTTAPEIKTPLAVTIYVRDQAKIEKLLHCSPAPSVLTGVAVDGDLEKPDVAIPETRNCRASHFEVTQSLGVVVPQASSSKTSTSTTSTSTTRP